MIFATCIIDSAQLSIDIAVFSSNLLLVELTFHEKLFKLDFPDATKISLPCQVRLTDYVGVDLNGTLKFLIEDGYIINGFNKDSFTPLHFACLSTVEDLQLVKQLIKEGADINAQSKSGATPLTLSCILPRPAVIECLLQAGADANINAEYTLDQVIDFLPMKQSLEILKCLLVYGLDLNVLEEARLLVYFNDIKQQSRSSYASLISLLLELGFSDHDTIVKFVNPSLKTQQPLSLQRISANRIRKSLSPKLYSNLMKVGELPKCLKQYIMMK